MMDHLQKQWLELQDEVKRSKIRLEMAALIKQVSYTPKNIQALTINTDIRYFTFISTSAENIFFFKDFLLPMHVFNFMLKIRK